MTPSDVFELTAELSPLETKQAVPFASDFGSTCVCGPVQQLVDPPEYRVPIFAPLLMAPLVPVRLLRWA